MAIALETANALTSTSTGTGAISAGNHALQNASGNDRVVALFVFSGSGQVGNIGISSITYNSVAPYASTTLNHTGSVARNVQYVALWRDADLPASSGSYAVAFTLSNQGASPWTYWYVIELTGVDQTTLPAEAMATNDNFATTTQTYTPTLGGDVTMGIISGANSTNTADPTFSWGTGDTELDETADSSAKGKAAAVGYTTDGSLSATSDTDMNTDMWIAFSLSAATASGVSVSLTGVQAAGQVGSLAPAGGALISLTGVQAAGQVGTLTIETSSGVSVSLTGVQAAGQVGSLAPSGGALFSLTGVQAAGQVGNLSILGDVIISLTGVQAAGQVGTLTIETAGGVSVSLTGVQAAGQVGSLVATGGAIAIPGGVSALGVVGNLSTRIDTIVNLLGVSAEGLVGALDITGGANVSITGVLTTGELGTLTINTGLSEVEIPGHRILKVQHEDRTYLVVYEDRTYSVENEDRANKVLH